MPGTKELWHLAEVVASGRDNYKLCGKGRRPRFAGEPETLEIPEHVPRPFSYETSAAAVPLCLREQWPAASHLSCAQGTVLFRPPGIEPGTI